MIIKYIGFGVALLLLFYAFDLMVFGILTPVFNPTIITFTDKAIRAFISIVIAGAVIAYLNKIEE